jgi:hypothetical protein
MNIPTNIINNLARFSLFPKLIDPRPKPNPLPILDLPFCELRLLKILLIILDDTMVSRQRVIIFTKKKAVMRPTFWPVNSCINLTDALSIFIY